MGIDSAEVKTFLNETKTVILWVEVFPTFKRHVMVWKHLSHFLSSSFLQNTTDYHFATRLFFLLWLLLIFNLLCFFSFFKCLLYGTSLGECMWIWQIHHIMSSSHLKPVSAFNTFFYFVVFIFLFFCIISDMKIILLNLKFIYLTKRVHLVTIAIHLFHFRRWFTISTD